MKRIALALVATTLLSSSAMAAKIGVSMAVFDDNFLTVLRNGMTDYAKTQKDVSLQVEDAKNDVSKQLSEIQNFVANKVDAIIATPCALLAERALEAMARALTPGEAALDRHTIVPFELYLPTNV